MPGFLMGVLQFGWLGVNIYFASLALSAVLPIDAKIIMVIWGVLAAFVGLKGIQYVAKIATYLPLIPIFTLIWLFAMTPPAGDCGVAKSQPGSPGPAQANLRYRNLRYRSANQRRSSRNGSSCVAYQARS